MKPDFIPGQEAPMSDFTFSVFPEQHFVDMCLYQYGYERCDPLHSYGPFARNHYLFHYVISGTGTLMAMDEAGQTRTYQIHSGHGFLIFPQQITTYSADETHPWEYTWAEFDGMAVKEAIMQTGLTAGSPIYRSSDRELTARMKDTLLTLARSKDASIYGQIGLLYTFMDLLARSSATRRVPKSGHMSDFYIKEAFTFVEQNFHNPIGVEDIADFCSLSRGYLNKVFKKYTGMSPQEFLIHYRMSKAAQLLKLTELSVGDIGKAVGYPNPLHFSRAFKTSYGLSPANWRKENGTVSDAGRAE